MIELISIVVPVRNEVDSIPILVKQLSTVLETLHKQYEIILVDDGSNDKTFEAINLESKLNFRVKGLQLRRNFGQTAAMKAGFDSAKGDICITLDGDLQHDPKYIPQFLDKIEEGFDLVCGYRQSRDDSLLRRVPSKFANLLARQLSSLKISDFGSTYRAYRREVIKEIPIYGEMHRFIPVFVGMVSSRISEIPIKVLPRQFGKSNYGIARTFRVISDLLVLLFFSKFFSRPIHIFGYISFLLGLPGLLLLFVLMFRKLILGIPILNYGPLFILGVLLCLMAGQMFTTGIVCEYLIRVFYKSDRAQPYSVASKVGDL